MSNPQDNLNSAILAYFREHDIKRGGDCPILRVTLVGYDTKGEPLFRVCPATGEELHEAAIGKVKAEGN